MEQQEQQVKESASFESINFANISPSCPLDNATPKKPKTPKKVLHFSDGTLEEYSSDDEEEIPPEPKIDPKSLDWAPWMFYWAKSSGKSALDACDYVGEGLANFFGITSPKYFYEIEEYKRSVREEEEQVKQTAEDMSGWMSISEINSEHPHTTEDGKIEINPSSQMNTTSFSDTSAPQNNEDPNKERF